MKLNQTELRISFMPLKWQLWAGSYGSPEKGLNLQVHVGPFFIMVWLPRRLPQ